ncbi:hypothetical protein UA75_30525 [Actinoalloteichus sp. GBA129-24]|uniref:DUF397 domain-containing protein n=1 Tax=Actinoalloteichus fjordicus TaxID=1612552 RepID=A0AAC9PUS0_9PSEU|nr:hypothetical protein UA74_29990 [Actinoalloteichus fjordicus]APU24068.1 hypothetical protein UA75_30525 [Actinoalloteichus sp. GBA129-24]
MRDQSRRGIRVLFGDGVIGVQDRKKVRGPSILVTTDVWLRFVRAVRRDEFFDFDVPDEILARMDSLVTPDVLDLPDQRTPLGGESVEAEPAVLEGSVIIGSARRVRFQRTTSGAPSSTPPAGSSSPEDLTRSPSGR